MSDVSRASRKRIRISLLAVGAAVLAVVPVAEAPAAPSPFDLDPSNVRFGRQTANTLSVRDVTVTNNNGDFVISAPAITGDTNAFGIQGENCPDLLPAGASCTVTVRFVPPQRGRYRGTLEIRSGVGVLLASARLSGSTPNN